ncbi:GntR family transcriptional regulator [Komagataeibacter sp. FNDCF1]|uniref:GntR family transcriptional regulator n=1 Tax=Komagataeibacter sp. FNDCF1 TaxID=2878681 RepID=UPI001E59F0A8|nr:GntR family transcriptional regulator [Komagataeibacter sp. FNDCF1]MCE2565211.1 GntR family transcriptional regulator [Komagataeibacter sp. FNDCF1]
MNILTDDKKTREGAPNREVLMKGLLRQLRTEIINGMWGPGQRLPEQELCHEYSVSRTPLRDALKELEREGLVTITPFSGATVTPVRSADLADRFQVLRSIEQFAAELLAQDGSTTAVEKLSALQDRMDQCIQEHDVAQYYRLNDDFHVTLVTECGNAALADMHAVAMSHIARARKIVNEYEGVTHTRACEHRGIIQMIEMKSPILAVEYVRAHLLNMSEHVLDKIMTL